MFQEQESEEDKDFFRKKHETKMEKRCKDTNQLQKPTTAAAATSDQDEDLPFSEFMGKAEELLADWCK